MAQTLQPHDDDILSHLQRGTSERDAAEIMGISRSRVRAAKQRAIENHGNPDEVPSLRSATQAFSVKIHRKDPRAGERGGRLISDSYAVGGMTSTSKFVGFTAPDGSIDGRDWKASIFTDASIEDMPASKLFSLLLSSSPEVSKGAHDFTRLFNPGNEIHAYRPGTDDLSDEGEAALGEIMGVLTSHYVSINTLFARLAMSLFSRGAMLGEVVLDDTGRRFVDLVVADPSAISFRRVEDDERGVYWQLGQWQGKTWVPLEDETIAYVPFDPLPDSPYGRAPIMPALFPALFLMGFLQDLRRVVANAGYNRIALSVDVPALLETARALSRNGAVSQADFTSFLGDVKRAIGDDFGALEPGDALVKDSNVSAESLAGSITTMNPGSMEGIVTSLERMCVKALKSIPLLHGITESTSDANANRQWEMLVASIKDMQHLAEDLLSRLLSVALQAMGVLAEVRVEFAELRAAEMLRDEQVEQLQIANAEHRMKLGWLTPSEAAIAATGFVSNAVGETYDDPDGSGVGASPVAQPIAVPDAAEVSADPAADRIREKVTRRKRKAGVNRFLTTTTEVNSFDEEEAARVFDEAVPRFAGLLDALPEPMEDDGTEGESR